MRWLVLQLTDSAFPMGAFAHSFGLEASVQLGLVRDARDVERFLVELVRNARHAVLPWMQRGFASTDASSLATVDRACDAFLLNAVANRASRLAGRALVRAIEGAFPDAARDLAPELGHLAPWSGALLRRVGCDWPAAVEVQLYWMMRGALSAAVRLGRIGPLAAQQLQRGLAPILEDELRRAHALPERAATTTPIADLAQSLHDTLYSRLFQS